MIDWHTHILPNLDDGSKSIDESITMLEMLKAQGVDIVVSTSHFYANDERVSSFIERRQNAYEKLCGSLAEDAPKIILGAEVEYYSGISRMEDLKLLRLGNSKVLLLEMPMAKWSNYTVKELIEISSSRDYKLLIAHIDRYMSYQSSKVLEQLIGNGVLMQANASFFDGFFKERKALKLLNEGFIHAIGSDCHNISSRPPRIGSAFNSIQKMFGAQYLNSMNDFGKSLLLK